MGEILTEREVAEHLKLSPATLRTWRSRGRGPVYTSAGGAIRYLVEDVERWLKDRRVEPGERQAAKSLQTTEAR